MPATAAKRRPVPRDVAVLITEQPTTLLKFGCFLHDADVRPHGQRYVLTATRHTLLDPVLRGAVKHRQWRLTWLVFQPVNKSRLGTSDQSCNKEAH